MDMSQCRFFNKVGFRGEGNSWVRMDHVERIPEDPHFPSQFPAVNGTDVRMVTWDPALEVWHATFGQSYKNIIRWRSPGFDDPVAAYVFAELNQWGR